MKIAIYTGTYVKDKDGVVRTLYQLVSTIKAYGHQVKIWSPDISKESQSTESISDVPAIPVPMYPDYKIGFFTPQTEAQLLRFQPDIIQISSPDFVGREFLLKAKELRIPVVGIYHTDFPSYLEYYNLHFVYKPLINYFRWFYNQCDMVFAPTLEMQHKLLGWGINHVKIYSRGIDKSLFDPNRRSMVLREKWQAQSKKVILFSGRFVWYKDLQVVIDVYEKIQNSPLSKKVKFVMIGSGPIEEELREKMPEAIFTGYLKHEWLAEAYASGDVFLFPSSTETFGNVVQEALASGLPAIVSDKGGCKEILSESRGGLIAKAKDSDAFYHHCLKLIKDARLYETCRTNGLEWSERRSWENINGELLNHYYALVERQKVMA